MYIAAMRISNELQIGKAGEYMVCADLIMKGFVAFPSEQGLPYDVLLDTGEKILRVQVKTTLAPRTVLQRAKESKAYIFNVGRNGKNNLQRFNIKDADLFALVCLDTRKVGYMHSHKMPSTINIRVDSLRGTHYDEKGIADYKKVLELKGTLSQTNIAKQLNLHVAQVNRMLKEGHKPYESGARYFSDFEREHSWFLTL